MDAAEARDHVRMLDGIVRSADRSVRIPPAILIGVGLICSTITALIQARQMGLPIPPDQYIQPPAFLLMLAVIGLAGRRARREGLETLLDGYAGLVFLVVAVVALTLNLTAQHRVIPADGMGLVWAGSFSGALLIIGAMGSRVLLAGGVAMLVATGAASLVPGWLPGLLSAAWFAGFVAPGLVLALGGARGRAPAL